MSGENFLEISKCLRALEWLMVVAWIGLLTGYLMTVSSRMQEYHLKIIYSIASGFRSNPRKLFTRLLPVPLSHFQIKILAL
jgi:hypothetical protein